MSVRWSATILLATALCSGPASGQPAPERGRPTQAEALQRQRERWSRLTPERRRQLRERYDRWKRLPSSQRKELRDRLGRLNALPEAQRHALQRRLQAWSRLGPHERRKMQARLEYWRRLSPEEKERVTRALWVLNRLLPEEFDAFKRSSGAERQERRQVLSRRLAALLAQPTERLRPLSELPPEERREALDELLEEGPDRSPAPAQRPERGTAPQQTSLGREVPPEDARHDGPDP